MFFKATSCAEPENFYRRESTIAERGGGGLRHMFGNFIMFWRNLNFARGYVADGLEKYQEVLIY